MALAYGRALRWVLRHPFVVRPTTWAVGVAAWFAVAFVVVTAGLLSSYSAVVLAALLLVPLVALFGWRRLTSQAPAPVVFLALFEPATPGAKDAASLHGQALKRRLTEGQLGAHVTLRELPVDVSREDAERLLDESGGQAVVYGRVKAIGSAATWEAELLARWPGEAGHAHLEGDVIEFHDRGWTGPSGLSPSRLGFASASLTAGQPFRGRCGAVGLW